MPKTVIVLNPYGSDVTNYVNRNAFYPQLLNGSITQQGDTVYTLPYDYSVSSIANIEAGAAMLNTYLTKTLDGQALVFGYSQGCQITDYWLFHYGPTSTVLPGQISFLNIGNADRKYGGFSYAKSAFDQVAWTGGIPTQKLTWKYVDFARQYDPIADFPQAEPLQGALDGIEVLLTNPNYLSDALNAVQSLTANAGFEVCVENLVAGLLYIHSGLGEVNTGYISVSPNAATNLWHTDSNGALYGISPTYPVPMLGISTWIPSVDKLNRLQIEQAYNRVFGAMPVPPEDS